MGIDAIRQATVCGADLSQNAVLAEAGDCVVKICRDVAYHFESGILQQDAAAMWRFFLLKYDELNARLKQADGMVAEGFAASSRSF